MAKEKKHEFGLASQRKRQAFMVLQVKKMESTYDRRKEA